MLNAMEYDTKFMLYDVQLGKRQQQTSLKDILNYLEKLQNEKFSRVSINSFIIIIPFWLETLRVSLCRSRQGVKSHELR